MSEPTPETQAPEASGAPAAPPDPRKLEVAREVLTELLRLLELPARLELKDSPDGGIAVALHVEGDIPGVAAGKRNSVVDSLQFLANKIVNKPNQERRWITIGLGGFPEPRQGKQQQQRPPQGQPSAPGPAGGPPSGQPAARPATQPPGQRPPKQGRAPQTPGQAPAAQQASRPTMAGDERSIEVPEDPAFAQAIRALAEKSAKLGRFYAITPLRQEDRARAVKAAQGIEGMRTLLEGEGRGRRVVLVPEKPTPMPRLSVMPDFDDEEDEEA